MVDVAPRLRAATVTYSGDDIEVRPQMGLLPEMKTIGARWDPRGKFWKIAACSMSVAMITDLLGDMVAQSPHEHNRVDHHFEINDRRLFTFQVGAAERLANSKRGMLLCMSPGLGKTATSIVAADVSVPKDQIVVVAPAKLLRQWRREIVIWGKGDTSSAIIQGGEPDWDEVRRSRWLITSWETMSLHQDWFKGDWPLWILDESVIAKSRKSTRSMALRGGTRKGKTKNGVTGADKSWENLRRSIGRVWLLSGSPTTRYADDLWAQLNLIWPRAFPSYWRFAERYCVVEENVWSTFGKTVIGTRRDRDAVKDNEDFILVINQEDVLDLPEYLPEAVDVELTKKQARAYESMQNQFVADLGGGRSLSADNVMDQLIQLQKIASYWEGDSAKHDALVALIEGGAYEPPYLIWTHWRDGAEALAARLAASGMSTGHVYGGMAADASDAIIEDYKGGRLDALVLSMGVGKYGHTLINSRTIVYVDKTWNADDYVQSLRRGRRIGLAHRPVLVTLRAPGTVDELVEMNLEGKVEGISRITNASLRELILGLGR